jgi:putative hydrolase of the HAD superfamily
VPRNRLPRRRFPRLFREGRPSPRTTDLRNAVDARPDDSPPAEDGGTPRSAPPFAPCRMSPAAAGARESENYSVSRLSGRRMARVVPHAIAFDLFHTLVDPEEFRPAGFRRPQVVAELLGLPVDWFANAWEAQLRERQVSITPTVVERVQALCRERGVVPPAKVWPEVDDIMGRFTDLAILNPRRTVVHTLQDFRKRGWTLGLLSNCDEREMRSWPKSELAPLFDAAAFSCELGVAKPSINAYRALVPRWGGVPLEEAVFVGDGANDELAGARGAGFSKVVFQSGFVSTNGLRTAAANERIRAQADTTVDVFGDLVKLLPHSAR